MTPENFCLSLGLMKRSHPISPSHKKYLFLVNFLFGFLHWLAGSYCWLEDSEGNWNLVYSRWFRHLFKVFLWSLEIVLFIFIFAAYRDWLLKATPTEISTAFLVKSVIFLYIKVFWPRVFPEILPGMHVFFCPQCYQRQTFKFTPISIKYGNYVTYLCVYCSCLVDGWGNQIYYPAHRNFVDGWKKFAGTMLVSGLMVFGGIFFGYWVWGLF